MLRKLNLTNLDEAINEAKRLLAHGYSAGGKWNLAQVCEHCSDWMAFPLDGYPKVNFPINVMLWLMKITIGKSMRNKILTERAFKPGGPTMPQTVKLPHDVSDAEAVGRFVATVERFKQFKGEMHASPLFGKMTNAEHLQLQVIHTQHHLRFLTPNNAE